MFGHLSLHHSRLLGCDLVYSGKYVGLAFQGNSPPLRLTVMIEAADFSEMSGHIYQTIRRHTPENIYLQRHCPIRVHLSPF